MLGLDGPAVTRGGIVGVGALKGICLMLLCKTEL